MPNEINRGVRDLGRETGAAETQFLRTELHTGLSFSKFALTADDELKIERNRTNARKAYDAVLHFLPGTSLSAEEAQEVQANMEQLKSALQQLGEDV